MDIFTANKQIEIGEHLTKKEFICNPAETNVEHISMLSYQHIYHAGCLADVHKHSALALILTQMIQKPKPLSYIETHAGRGLYDIHCSEAEKTGEAKAGITKLLDEGKLGLHHPYSHVINDIRHRYGESYYPGSPYIAKTILNMDDQIHLIELHPQEYSALKKGLRGKNIHIHRRDGYAGALALSPPTPRRGLVFIDPSYEIKNEYETMASYILKLHQKWPEAVIMLWYPILKAGYHDTMKKQIESLNLPKLWLQEVRFSNTPNPAAMLGSGLLCVNTPFGVDAELDKSVHWF